MLRSPQPVYHSPRNFYKLIPSQFFFCNFFCNFYGSSLRPPIFSVTPMRSSGSRVDWKIFFVIFTKLIPRKNFFCIANILVLMVTSLPRYSSTPPFFATVCHPINYIDVPSWLLSLEEGEAQQCASHLCCSTSPIVRQHVSHLLGVFQRPLTLTLLQKYHNTNGRRIVIQIGGVNTPLCQEESILLQKYRDRNGRCIAILFRSIRVRGRWNTPEFI